MFDNISKFLIEQFPEDFASWLIGEPIALSELSPSELSLEPIRADALILLQSDNIVLHCEFQTNPDPTMPFRMADYALRVYRRFPQKQMVQVVIYLRATESELVSQTNFTANNLRHEFQVVRLWEQPTEVFFQRPGLLPYAVLSQTDDRVEVLQQVAEAIEAMGDRNQRSNVSAATGIMAGLILNQDTIRRVLRRELMQESVVYQELREEARQEARHEVRQELQALREKARQEAEEALQEARQEAEEALQEARQEAEEALQEARQEAEEALQEAKQSEVNLVLRLLARRVNQPVPDAIVPQIQALSFAQLEEFGEALLDFTTLADVETWLNEHASE
ncbi:Rpn family recombination-promoting nuclease/putative transposase [Egbenema bharatensis]|uniref:Rpn family recombination-promoting nuclease/putative transposase n=1 Tax=Egbenema bharatensis TaxID=3463334 RepID=UPI003A8C7139